MKAWVFCLISACLSAACGRATHESSTQEIASEFGHPFLHSLYWRTGTNLNRADCRNNTTIYDHASCNQNPVSVPVAAFYHELESQFGVHTEQLTDLGAEAFTRVEQIDLKLLELLNGSSGTPQRPELPAQIAAAGAAAKDANTKIVGLRDQVARIQQALAQQENPDLRLQLADLGKQIGDEATKLVAAQARLAALRQEYVEANASVFDAEMYQHLQNQRENLVDASDAYQRYVAAQAKESIQLRRLLAMLEENFIYVEDFGSDGAYMGLLMPFDEIIDDLTKGPMRYLSRGDLTTRRLTVEVPVDMTLKSMQCRFDANVENRCLEVLIAAPSGESSTMANRYLNTRNFSGQIMANPLVNGATRGSWQFEIKNVCDGQAVTLRSEPWCEVGVD